MSLWWFGWSGTLFLSSTRVILRPRSTACLPEWVSKIEPRTKTPIYALLLMVIPAVIVSYLYAFKIFNFNTLALDATVVIAITFLGIHHCRNYFTLAGKGCIRWLSNRQVQGPSLAGLDRCHCFCDFQFHYPHPAFVQVRMDNY